MDIDHTFPELLNQLAIQFFLFFFFLYFDFEFSIIAEELRRLCGKGAKEDGIGKNLQKEN